MSQSSNTQCSNCGRTKMKFDVFTTKCSEHSYILCNPCTRRLRGEQCPQCKEQKSSNGGHLGNKGEGAENGGNSEVKAEKNELRKLMKDLLLTEEENKLLLKEKNNLERERDQKDLQVKNIQLQIYKIREQSAVKLEQLKADHAKEIAKLKDQYDKEYNLASKKAADEYQEKLNQLIKEKQDIRKNAQLQKQEMNKNFELEKTILKSNFSNEKQAFVIEMQGKRSEEVQAAENRLKETTRTLQEQIEFYKFKYENQLAQLKAKSEKERQELIIASRAEQEALKSSFAEQKLKLQKDHESEKEALVQAYKKQHGELRGSFLVEKGSLEQKLERKNEDLQNTINRMNQQKKALREESERRQFELRSKLQSYQSIINEQKRQLQKVSTERLKLSNYIESQGKSLQSYNKELTELEEYIQRNNEHIIAQFKSLDDSYAEPTPEKLKQVQMLVKQYRSVAETTHHPVLKKMIAEKEQLVNNHIVDFMKNFDQHLQEVQANDIFRLDSERGRKLSRIIEKIDLVRTLENKNINDNIEIHFYPKLFFKFRQLITKFNLQIISLNKEVSEFELIKEIDYCYTFTDYLSAEFPQHRQACDSQYKKLNETIVSAFERFTATYNVIKQDKQPQKLQEYLGNAQRLKKFIQILHHGKQYPKYTYYLQQHLKMKMHEIKWEILSTLNNNKKGLKAKLDTLMQSRVYYDCFLYQKIFKKLKIFDEILTKEENSYHNFNFTELYNKILNFLKILKEEKLNLVDVIITQDKITIDDLQREYASVSFDQSVKNKYLYKIKNVLQNRSTHLSKITPNTLVTNKHLQEFEIFFLQLLKLKNIKQVNEIAEVQDQLKLFDEKVTILLAYLEKCFHIYYINSLQFKELEETSLHIRHFNQFEGFAKEYFPPQHREFKKKLYSNKLYRLPRPQAPDQIAFSLLLKFNMQRSDLLNEVINSHEEPLKDEHFQFYTNMVKYVPKVEVGKLQNKLLKSIEQSITELEGKEWVEGETNSAAERKLMQKLNKLQNKEIAYYRELIAIHKNKVIEQRQKLISNEKRRLKEDDFENLEYFLEDCKKHEKNNKFYKLYLSILQEYMNYSYDNISQDIGKKTQFLHNMYRLKLHHTTPAIREIFKSKEYKIYFCRPELLSIKNNVNLIEKFEGENQQTVEKASEMLLNLFKIYSVFQENDDRSLLDDRERQKLQLQIDSIKNGILSNYQNLCKNVEHQKIFEEGCNRKRLFLHLIKIEIYARLMRKIHHMSPFQQFMKVKGMWEDIIKRINVKLERMFEEIKQFRFYREEFKLQYDNRHFLFEHLKKIELIVEAFKDIKYKLFKFESYLKNNYLDGVDLNQINYKEVIRIVEMSWIKEYALIKKEISEMFHSNKMEIVLKYKMILHEQEIVRNQNLLSCNEIIKEEYDFKKIVIEELTQIEEKLDKNVHNLEKDYESFSLAVKKMEEKKKLHIETERGRIRHKYERLINEIKNSFHEIDNEALRQQKIEGQINTLHNQSKAQEQILLSGQAVKIEQARSKFNSKAQKAIMKIFEHFNTLKKVEANFDSQIQQICRDIFSKVQIQIDKYDKNLKAFFLNYIKKSKNNDFVINSMNIFKAVNEEQFQQNTKGMNDIHKILSKCPQTASNQALSAKIVLAFEEYQKQLLRVEKDYYDSKSETQVLQLIKQTKQKVKQLSPPVILARIFAVYAIYRNIDSHQQEINFDGNPHAAQVLAILLLVDAQNMGRAKLDNKLIEVKTGEGKSRVLGGLNCYLALKGYDVYCGCYSSYLSKRDQQEFRSLFIRFQVGDTITYGAFSQHCESLLNQSNKHNFKEVTKKVLLNEKLTPVQLEYLERLNRMLNREGQNNRILVIDEVDVFFDEKYFGQLYTPGVAINAPEVKTLMRFIWEHRNDDRLNRVTFQSEEYANLLNLYPHLKELLKNQVESMLHACKHYNVHPYEIRNHQIQYVDNDSVNQKLNFGYSTAFTSFYEYERGKISEENYNKNTNISLIIGQFSYAELPKYFNHIMGVSGTVEAMSEFRKKIMRQQYKIGQIFTLPSIYGQSRRDMIPPKVCLKVDFVKHLLNRVREVRKQQRPILIFFEGEETLNQVANSPDFNQFANNIYKITEKMPPEMRNPLINYAGTRNRITLISSAFSRGTDFTVFDNEINEKGGMHVIQTYISKNYSDFIQISGRTARQGKNGSFEMLITVEDLVKNEIPMGEGAQLLGLIQKSWEKSDAKHGQELSKAIQKAYKQHQITFQVVSSLSKQNSKLVDAVKRLNYNQVKSDTIRTVIAIDGTGSMGAALNAVFSILNDTISRTEDIIKMRMPNVSFEHKIMIYRNYNIKPMERVLQQSNFSKNSKYLEDFMSCIKPEGGLGNEAHEILFYQIGKVYQMEAIDQIIIIGDAPANKHEEMVKHRKKFHGQALWSTIYPLLPSIEAYSAVLNAQKIPVHSFYILRKKQEEESIKWDNNVKQYFKELSQRSSGVANELNIRDQNEAKEQLTHFISESVLQLIGGKDLVQLYKQMFSIRYV